jgi:outer membrane protein assembly factor BamB
VFNLRVASYKGAPVLTWWEGTLVTGTGHGEYVLVDQTYSEVARVRAGNGLQGDLHEFITTPEGTALFTAYSQQATPGSGAESGAVPLLDSIVQEVDIATGRLLFEWRASDHVATSESYVGPSAGQAFDYFHVNSIDVDTDGNLLISARHTSAVYKIDRRSGEVIWRLGGRRSDFAMGPGTVFAWQHDARRQPDGSISLFDDGSNGSKPPTESQSRGLVLDVNESTHATTLLRQYSHVGGILATSQGSMQPLSNGNVLVGWGDQPYFTEFAANGSVVMDARLPAGSTSYRALRFAWNGRPADHPAIAMEQSDAGTTTVYASWNGATDVATWVVLGGDAPDGLVALGSQPRSGFETAIVVPGRPLLVAVRALDSSGAVLTQSLPLEAD